MNNEQIRRTIEAKAETQRHLDRELAYLPKHQKQEMVGFYRAHLVKLNAMLAAS